MPVHLKGLHRALPPALGLHFGRRKMVRYVRFDESCAYDLRSADQLDINKLFGLGYFPHHHEESARFGWHYNKALGMVSLFAYCYVRGERKSEWLCTVPLNRWIRLHLIVSKTCYYFAVVDHVTQTTIDEYQVDHFHKKKWSYPLGAYFGGNNPAPHRITIKMLKGK